MTTQSLKPPTAIAGYTDFSFWGFSLTDALEHVPVLHFPASISVYAEMRRDPQLAAVLAGITLPLRRANWQVDPAGCRPEVAQLVADDLGLPILGNDDVPGPARIRGVSWGEHLRSALLHLVYGFYTFELLADTSSGQARLKGLYERVPVSIAFIHADENGDFGGISQILRPGGKANEPEIPPERLVHYVHDREGAAWAGTSMLRPGYSTWFIKQDLRRVLATSHRRFGMGVPTVEWAPGSNPTPNQISQAQQAASAARVGEYAGMSMPPGAHLVLAGLSGSVPDTLGALRWLDQQISGMVLSRWMDLGSTQTGSRALGESFIDTFLLSIQSLADSVADTATRQIVARVVEWNWGPDEPVPKLSVGDVGTRHEVTADALNALMQSGALSADPRLEEWVRRTYHLPERDPAYPWKPPRTPANAASDGSQTDALAIASSRKPAPRRRKQNPGQLALSFAAAADPPADQQAIADDRDKAAAAATAALAVLLAPLAAGLAIETAHLVASGALASLATLTPDPTVIAAVGKSLGDGMSALADTSATRAAGELAALTVTVDPIAGDAATIEQTAQATASLIGTRLAASAAQTAMGKTGADLDQIEAAVRADLDAQVSAANGWVAGTVDGSMATAQHSARMTTLAQADGLVDYRAVEEHDSSSCAPCDDINDTTYQTYAAAAKDYPLGGGYIGCLGRGRCRGQVVPIAKQG